MGHVPPGWAVSGGEQQGEGPLAAPLSSSRYTWTDSALGPLRWEAGAESWRPPQGGHRGREAKRETSQRKTTSKGLIIRRGYERTHHVSRRHSA